MSLYILPSGSKYHLTRHPEISDSEHYTLDKVMHLCFGLGYEWFLNEGSVVFSICESDDIQNLVKILILFHCNFYGYTAFKGDIGGKIHFYMVFKLKGVI